MFPRIGAELQGAASRFFLEVFDRHEEDSPGMNRSIDNGQHIPFEFFPANKELDLFAMFVA